MAADTLFGPYDNHGSSWQRAHDVKPGICPGKDTLDVNCKCPDVIYATKIRIITSSTLESRIYCGCCTLPITFP